jgi:uncharacterized Ntn-hydrolase superfamily protein
LLRSHHSIGLATCVDQSSGADGAPQAAILVIRNGGGRGYDNSHYIRPHVDDHPTPITELRRLLMMQIGPR